MADAKSFLDFMIPITAITGRLGNQMFQYAYIYSQYRKGNVPDVYLQTDEYISPFRDEIRAVFGSGIGHIDYVGIHVRRGDYVNNDFYVDLFKEGYYERAMSEFPGEKFIVFSDDIDWCKKQEIFKDCAFSENNTEIDDMNLLASCKGIIIANSSFSWWSAYLSTADKIIAPISWYSDGEERTKCPTQWKRI